MNFKKENVIVSGSRGEYWVGYEGKFVARFKYANAKTSANDFVKFMIHNVPVEEYFQKMDAGAAPLNILEEYGYVAYNIRKALKAAGYAPTQEGKAQYVKAKAKVK